MNTLTKTQNRNTTLDLLKLIAAFCVVFIHYKFFGKLGVVVDALGRVAVPLFFITSGYYSLGNTVEKLKAKAIRLIKMFIVATLIYHTATVAVYLVQGEFAEIYTYLAQALSIKQIIKFLCFNNTVSSTHLWFLLALAYAYVVHIFATKLKLSNKVLTAYAVTALSLHLILGNCLELFDITVPHIYLRNFALMGYPFFILGLVIREHEHKIVGIKNSLLFALFCAGAVETLAIRYLTDFKEMFLGTILMVFALFAVALKHPDVKLNSFVQTLCECNLYIYLYHKLVGVFITKGLSFLQIDITQSALLTNLVAISVAVLSTALALILYKFQTRNRKDT